MSKRWPMVVQNLMPRTCFSSSSTTTPFPLKNVTRTNFISSLAELRIHVAKADFIAIDLEMTGITSAVWRESFEFDRYDIRYLKVKDSAEKFAVVQFGLCPFCWDGHRFVAYPYNFFVFPRPELPEDDLPREFMCQTASIEFLAKYQFDFNTCIHEGVSYLSRSQENIIRKRLIWQSERELLDLFCDSKENSDMPLVSMTDVFFCERMKNALREWRDGLLRNRNSESHISRTSEDSEQQFQTVFYKMRPSISLSGFSSHQLNLIKLVTKRHFKDLTCVRITEEDSLVEQLLVYTDSEADRDLLMKEMKEEFHREAEMKIETAIGIRHVIDLLSSEQKLILGHNSFLDFAHIHNKFLGPLPFAAEEFVSAINKSFPFIIDTKVLLNSNDVLQRKMKKMRSSLSSAFSFFCPEIAPKSNLCSHSAPLPSFQFEVHVDDMRYTNLNPGLKHEAGYDAFMTGCVFAQACSHLGVDFELCSRAEKLAHNEKLQGCLNLLHISWSNVDAINLSNGIRTSAATVGGAAGNAKNQHQHAKVPYEKMLLLWNFPSKLKTSEIKDCVSQVHGGLLSVTHVHRIDETAVFIQFGKAEHVSEFLSLKDCLERHGTVMLLHPLSKLLEGGRTCAGDYETYRDICASVGSKPVFAEQAEAMGFNCKANPNLVSDEECCKSQ